MRNLRYIHSSYIESPADQRFSAVAWDVTSDSALCAFGPTIESDLIELKRWRIDTSSFIHIASWDAPCPAPDIESDQVVVLHYFPETSLSCVVFAGGDLIVVREDPQDGEDKIEIVGSVDAGITGAAWSPDGELLAVTTKASTLLYMTSDFENVIEFTLTLQDLAISQHVSVGWGKKETQFKGKKARALRDPTVPETVDEGSLSVLDQGEVTLSWRGDGAYVAINSVVHTDAASRRVIRVFSRDGLLDSVSEPVNGLEGCLSWKPSGSLIAGVQRLDDQLRVIFFERNGLRHGQFDLRLSKDESLSWGKAVSLQWNAESSVLAVCFTDRVQLWTMGNYHYYLKQEIRAPKAAISLPLQVAWHPEQSLHLLISDRSSLRRVAYAFIIAHHSTTPPHDYGMVGVIDGSKSWDQTISPYIMLMFAGLLRVTPLRATNIPPPMSLHEINLPDNIIDVAFSPDKVADAFCIIAVLHHRGMSIFEWSMGMTLQEAPISRANVSIAEDFRFKLQIALFHNRAALLCDITNDRLLSIMNLHEPYEFIDEILVQDPIEGIVSNGPNTVNEACVLCRVENDVADSGSRETIDFRPHADAFSVNTLRVQTVKWQTHCKVGTKAEGLNGSNGQNASPEGIVFTLAQNGNLYANKKILVKNCTSFVVTPKYLLFTTTQNLLKTIQLFSSCEGTFQPPAMSPADIT